MKPLNNHVKIKPIEYDSFTVTSKGKYEEMGEVIDTAVGVTLPIGSVVYFDSWLAKKYPVKGQPGEYVWFVNYDDIVAYEEIPEQPV